MQLGQRRLAFANRKSSVGRADVPDVAWLTNWDRLTFTVWLVWRQT